MTGEVGVDDGGGRRGRRSRSTRMTESFGEDDDIRRAALTPP
jgi:hypothetical protein